MKRFLILALLLVAGIAWGQALIYTPNATLSWNAVTELDDATLIDLTDVVEYEVGRSADPVADRNAPEVILGTTNALAFGIILPQDGTWYTYAVRSVLTTDGGATVMYSGWNWSDQNGAATPAPFWYRHPATVPPSIPMGFAGN